MRFNILSQSIIKDWFDYNPKTGKLLWRRIPGKRSDLLGQEVGCIFRASKCKTSYRRFEFRGKHYLAHVLIWILHHGSIPQGFEPDHIDHNGLNNIIDNLRLVTCLDNNHNRSMSKCNVSGVTGVCYHKGKWMSQIGVRGKTVYLGVFEDILDAEKARKDAEIKYNFHRNHGMSNGALRGNLI
jgi:hypothetical protein